MCDLVAKDKQKAPQAAGFPADGNWRFIFTSKGLRLICPSNRFYTSVESIRNVWKVKLASLDTDKFYRYVGLSSTEPEEDDQSLYAVGTPCYAMYSNGRFYWGKIGAQRDQPMGPPLYLVRESPMCQAVL